MLWAWSKQEHKDPPFAFLHMECYLYSVFSSVKLSKVETIPGHVYVLMSSFISSFKVEHTETHKKRERDRPKNRFLAIEHKLMVTSGDVKGRMGEICDGDERVHISEKKKIISPWVTIVGVK